VLLLPYNVFGFDAAVCLLSFIHSYSAHVLVLAERANFTGGIMIPFSCLYKLLGWDYWETLWKSGIVLVC